MAGLVAMTPAATAFAASDLTTAPPTLDDCNSPRYATVLQPARDASPPEARAVWLDPWRLRWPAVEPRGRFRLYHSALAALTAVPAQKVTGADGVLELGVVREALPADLEQRFRYVAAGVTLRTDATADELRALHRGQLLLVQEGDDGTVLQASRVQSSEALDGLYATAGSATLGARVAGRGTDFAVWAPTARSVALCLYDTPTGGARAVVHMKRDESTGAWRLRSTSAHAGGYYLYLVDVLVDGVGLVRNRVTDPYSLSLTTDSQRSYVADLEAPALVPAGWRSTPPPDRVRTATDAQIYELHVRDFSAGDETVPPAHRGKYLAFTDEDSAGMRHLRALAAAGVTDVHLLPVFDFATVPEAGCVTPRPSGSPDGESQQAAVMAVSARDCFNWGYDPLHWTAPEGSYATDPSDGAVRVLEFRRMVQALHGAGLRVGMDVVYNHSYASGQDRWSVLDRIVPGYYHRLDAGGSVATSTCCANTATEHRMMAKLMIDSVVTWARDYAIDSFRFDLMGHQPRAVMEELQRRVDAATGRHVLLLGEGWNFGEIADGARFVQASQRSLAGSGIATFSDRARDAIRGGGAGDAGIEQVRRQGYVNGLHYDPNADAQGLATRADLMRAADLVRIGLAGSLQDYRLRDSGGRELTAAQVPYGDQPAGYAASPGEVVNYVENHDNQTLYDLDAFKLPVATTSAERARVQVLAAALNAFSQGIAYWHAGFELLRSKSMDRNSFNSGDWFNRVDWSGRTSAFGSGLPPAPDNESSWPLMRPRLADAAIRPTPADIAWTRGAVLDLMRIRASTTLLRLPSATEIAARLRFPNSGPDQVPDVIVGQLDGRGLAGANFDALVYLVNVDLAPHSIEVEEARGRAWQLHPVHRAAGATDRRAAELARWDPSTATFTVPARTAVVFVVEPSPPR